MNGLYAEGKTRPAAVAGTFYSQDAGALKKEIQQYLKNSADVSKKYSDTHLLISPHAGYVFSGPVAARGYATISRNITRVFVIGPSHYKFFEGIVLPTEEYYETPLGKIKIDTETVNKLRKSVLVADVEGAGVEEHSIEVQLPFLQVQLQNFLLIPVLVGNTDPQKVAQLLFPFMDENTLVVGSSDLSHFHQQEQARTIDDQTVAAILAGKVDGAIDACGELPIRIVMSLAKMMHLEPLKLDARTSYETAPEYGSKSRVVGYASIIFTGKSNGSKEKQSPGLLSSQLQNYLLKLARESLVASVNKKPLPSPDDAPSELKTERGCFVTLTINGSLRGCIGYIDPIRPLYKAVIENARNAALSDPRFTPVTDSELTRIHIEVSVLTVPRSLQFKDADDLLQKLHPFEDGVILQKGYYQSTFLPQVWEQLPDKVQFLEHLALKAGMPADGWKTADVQIYQAQHFEEQ